MRNFTEEASLPIGNDAILPLRVLLLRKQGVLDIRFREYDRAILLENPDLLVTTYYP
jgi:hypothetical protein